MINDGSSTLAGLPPPTRDRRAEQITVEETLSTDPAKHSVEIRRVVVGNQEERQKMVVTQHQLEEPPIGKMEQMTTASMKALKI